MTCTTRMAIYRFWIISLAEQSVIYTRFFPHLEKQDRFEFPWITPQELVRCLFVSLGIETGAKTKNFSEQISDSVSFRYSRQDMLLSGSLSGSTSSLTSIGSSVSTATTGTMMGSSPRPLESQSSMSGSFVSESNILNEYICLYNHFPLIVCPLVNLNRKLDDDNHPNKKPGIENLIMLVYEQNGFLFLCCPRLTSARHRNDPVTTFNECFENDQLLVEEHSISLSYTILQMMASMFFSAPGGKPSSLKTIECFISAYLPFGKLIRTKPDILPPISSPNQSQKDTIICLRITESVSTSFQTFSTKNFQQKETIFGTITLNLISSSDFRLKSVSGAQIILNIENIGGASLMLPSNCMVKDQGSSLVYDVGQDSQYGLNAVHYKFDQHNQPSDNHLEEQILGCKLFTSKYVIQKKSGNDNLHHVSLRLRMNDRICTEDIKFNYFMIRFSLNQRQNGSKKKSSVQTMNTTSLNNLIVRDSIKMSHGQIKLENSMVVWVIGTRLPKSRKATIDFDLLIATENLSRLETMANFSHTFQFKSLMVQRSSKQPSDNRATMKECRTDPYPPNMVIPCLKLSKVSLTIESPSPTEIIVPRKSNEMSKEFFQIDYHLNSFEYRIFPILLTDSVSN